MNCHDFVGRFVGLSTILLFNVFTCPSVFAVEHLTPDVCQKIHPATGDFILLVDANFRRVAGNSLRIGEIDFSRTRTLTGAYYIVNANKFNPDVSLGGEELRPAIESNTLRCPHFNVSPLTFGFDSSSLPPGAFSQPISIYRDDPAKPPLEAEVNSVSGFVKRVWIEAKVDAADVQSSEIRGIRVLNSGNITSGVMNLVVRDDPYIKMEKDGCTGRTLAPKQTCDLTVRLDLQKLGGAREEYEVPIGMSNLDYVENKIWLHLQDGKFQVFSTNK